MPILTYMGPRYQHRRPDNPNDFIRGKALEVSQAWLDKYRKHVTKSGHQFLIVGDEGVHSDEDNDGVSETQAEEEKQEMN